MAEWFFIKDFAAWEIVIVIVYALSVGMTKTGLTGVSAIMVPAMALVFGAKESTGIVLPMLCFADLLAVIWYRRSAEWKHVWRLLPGALAGLIVAIVVERFVPARGFRFLIGFCLFAGLAVMIWNDVAGLKSGGKANVPSGWWFSALFGLAGGFSTMIGNAAGPIMSVFLLSMRLPKDSFVGTTAWYFLIVNYIKIPLQIFFWHNITREGLLFDLCLVPVVVLGAGLGIVVVKKVSEKVFRVLIYAMTIISTALMFINFS